MEIIKPNPISEYYIAYFDILGYREFFIEHPEKASEFLGVIHSVINNTQSYIKSINESPFFSAFANFHIYSKIFSDNILLCIEVGNDIAKEKMRLITFMGLISEIQRKIITNCGLFIRGAFTKGKLSINDDYVFGEGLIEAVNIEESTSYPRIAITDKIIDLLENNQMYSCEESEKAISIGKRIENGDSISDEEKNFYERMLQLGKQVLFERNLALNLLYKFGDDVWSLSYLYCLDIRSFVPEQTLDQLIEAIKSISPSDYEKIPNSFPNIDAVLASHKNIVEQKLIKYGNYASLDTADVKQFERQERILKKYIWAMVYHNDFCNLINNPEYHINTQSNCERRHMKQMIIVFNQNENNQTNTPSE